MLGKNHEGNDSKRVEDAPETRKERKKEAECALNKRIEDFCILSASKNKNDFPVKIEGSGGDHVTSNDDSKRIEALVKAIVKFVNRDDSG